MKRFGFGRLPLSIVMGILCVGLLAPAGMAAEPSSRTEVTDKARSTKSTAQPLSPDELTTLSQRSEDPDEKVVGGSLTNQQLTYIVIALAAAVIVLIVVAA